MLEYARSCWDVVITQRSRPTARLAITVAGLLIAHITTFAAAGSEWRALATEELPTSITADLAVGNKTSLYNRQRTRSAKIGHYSNFSGRRSYPYNQINKRPGTHGHPEQQKRWRSA